MNRIVRFCAEECRRQGSGEISVANMFDAWMWARSSYPHPYPADVEMILEIGKLVEPECNENGFRTVPVRIGYHICKVVDFTRLLKELCDSPLTKDPVEFYREFELMHPFLDGNGRTGVILFNYLQNYMDDPIVAPDVKNPNFFDSRSE